MFKKPESTHHDQRGNFSSSYVRVNRTKDKAHSHPWVHRVLLSQLLCKDGATAILIQVQ